MSLSVLTTFTKNRILVYGIEGNQIEGVVGATAITPGMWCKMGTDGLYVPHDAVGGDGPLLIAKENPYVGKTVNDAYAAGERFFMHKASPGELVHMRVKTGESIAKGVSGISDGAGSIEAVTGTPKKYPVVSQETISVAASNPLALFRVE